MSIRRGSWLVVPLLLVAWWVLPTWAQVRTERPPSSAASSPSAGNEALSPSPLPLETPGAEQRHAVPLVRTGRLDVHAHRIGDFRWLYRIVNGTQRDVTSMHMMLPRDQYDSRLSLLGPDGWVTRREPGQGAWKGEWLLSWFAVTSDDALKAGRAMTVELRSGSPLLPARGKAGMLFGASAPDRLILPWDDVWYPVPVAPTASGSTHPDLQLSSIRYPAFSYQPPHQPVVDVTEALRRGWLRAAIYGGNRHSGEAFLMSVRAERTVVATVSGGELLLPSRPQFDELVVARNERLPLMEGDEAAISLRCFSVTYGRRAPPPRLSQYELSYHLAHPGESEVSPEDLAEFQRIVARADRLTPRLTTPVGQDYPDLVEQWGLWRKERILAGRPLEIRALEQDLALYYQWSGTRRLYLNPLQVRQLANEIWADTDSLLYLEPPTLPGS